MKLTSYIICTIALSIVFAVVIFYLLKGKIKKYTREELEEKQFGKNN